MTRAMGGGVVVKPATNAPPLSASLVEVDYLPTGHAKIYLGQSRH
ncbi:hypothetical protein ABT154_00865 [Streptomyces sp. NPDC001728]